MSTIRQPLVYKGGSFTLMKLLKYISLTNLCLIAGLFMPVILKGQACCSGGSPVSGVLGVTSSERNAANLMVTYDFHFMNRLYNEEELLEVDQRRRQVHTLLVEGSYGFTDRLSVSTMFSFLRQSRKIKTTDDPNKTSLMGVGDAIVLLKYNLLGAETDRPFQVTLGAGPKVPLGRNDIKGDNGLLLAPDLQPGSGAWDVMFWGYMAAQNLLNAGVEATTYLNYQKTTPTTRANSDLEYQYGDEFQATLGLNKSVVIGSEIWIPSISGKFRTLEANEADEDALTNSGGQWLYIKPGIGWNINPKSSLTLSSEIPVYQNLNGTQLGSTVQLSIAYEYSFNQIFNSNETNE